VEAKATAAVSVVLPAKVMLSAEVVTSAPVETVPEEVPRVTVPPAVISEVLLKDTVPDAKFTVPLAPPAVVLSVAPAPREKDPLEVTEKLPE